MTFKTADQINEHLIQLTQTERKLTHEILTHIQLFDKISGFLKLGYPTLYSYLKGELKYSEDQAYRRVKAAKLLNTIPEVAEKIRNGTMNLTQAMQLQSAITQTVKLTPTKVGQDLNKLKGEVLKQKAKSIIEKIENKNSFDTQKIIAEELNLPASTRDKVKPQSNQTIKLEVHFTTEQYEKLKQIKSLYSHKFPTQKISDIIEHLCDQALNKGEKRNVKSQIKSANEHQSDNSMSDSTDKVMEISMGNTKKTLAQSPESLVLNKVEQVEVCVENRAPRVLPQRSPKTRHLPNAIRRFVIKRAENKCEFTSKEGRKCNSDFQLEIEHKVPFSQGGSNSVDNLLVYCGYHNAHSATQLNIGFENWL